MEGVSSNMGLTMVSSDDSDTTEKRDAIAKKLADLDKELSAVRSELAAIALQPAVAAQTLVVATNPSAPVTVIDRPRNFLDLPTEVRNLIYRYLFRNGEIARPHFYIKPDRENGTYNFPAKSLSVNKVFNEEATQVLFGQNIFRFDNFYEFYFFVRCLGKIKSSFIKDVEVANYTRGRKNRVFQQMGSSMTIQQFLGENCPNLQRLRISQARSSRSNGEWTMPELKDIQAFKAAIQHLTRVFFQEGTVKDPLSWDPSAENHKSELCFVMVSKEPKMSHNDLSVSASQYLLYNY